MGQGLGKSVTVGDSQYEILKQLAEGGYSYVFVVRDVNTGKEYAMKRMLAQDKEMLALAKSEVALMRRLRKARGMVQMVAADSRQADNGTEVLIIMELCNESLPDVINHRLHSKRPFTPVEILNIFEQVCESVAVLHSMSPAVAHRDLKIENVLRGKDGSWKLCDFGSCTTRTLESTNRKDILQEEDIISRYSTLTYRAPEMVDLYQFGLVNEKVDIWSLGCILYTLCYFKHPFDEGASLQIINVKYSIPKSPQYPRGLVEMLQALLIADPRNRPGIQEVMQMVAAVRKDPSSLPSSLRPVGFPSSPPEARSPAKTPPTKTLPARTAPANTPPVTSQAAPRRPSQPRPSEASFACFDDVDWDKLQLETDQVAPSPTNGPQRSPPAQTSKNGGGALFGMLDWHSNTGHQPQTQQSQSQPQSQQRGQHSRTHSRGGSSRHSFSDDGFGDEVWVSGQTADEPLQGGDRRPSFPSAEAEEFHFQSAAPASQGGGSGRRGNGDGQRGARAPHDALDDIEEAFAFQG